jgi:hypothetical protein
MTGVCTVSPPPPPPPDDPLEPQLNTIRASPVRRKVLKVLFIQVLAF